MIVRQVVLRSAVYLVFCTVSHADEIILNGRPCNSYCQSWMGVKTTDSASMKPAHERETSGLDQDVSKKIRRPTLPIVLPSIKQTAIATKIPASPMIVEDAHNQPLLPLAPEDRIGPPDPSKIVAARGVIMIQTPEEEAFDRKQRADLMKETTKRDPGVGDVDLH